MHVIDKGFKEFIHLSVAGIFSLCAEWWSFEVITFLVGLLGATQLAVHVIYSTLIPLYFMIPLGVGIGSAARIGALIGENRHNLAKRLSNVIIGFTFAFSILLVVLSYVFRAYLPLIFTKNESVIKVAVALNPLFCGMIIVDALQGVLQGILRGIKQQGRSVFAVLIGSWLITIPLACLLAFDKGINLGVFGMWVGNNVGYAVMDMIFFYILLTYKWTDAENEDVEMEMQDEKQYVAVRKTPATMMSISHYSAFVNLSTPLKFE